MPSTLRARAALRCALTLAFGLMAAQVALASARIPADAQARLSGQGSVDVIVEYDAAAIDRELTSRRRASERFDSDASTALRATRYQALKSGIDQALPKGEIEHLADFSHLPMAFKRVRSAAALKALAAQAGVRALFVNQALHPVASANLAMVGQPLATSVGYGGAGTTVAVLDNGIDYSNPAFGGCTAPGVPLATCRVAVSRTVGTGSADNTHGTNVSAIVAGVAPGARVAMLNVFSGNSAYTADILSAISWVISHRSTYNIVAINMSLGDGSRNTAPCSGSPLLTPASDARNAGITVVAAAGNDAYADGLNMPACTPGIVSVGAVYADQFGGLSWGGGTCTDYATAADQITCFSNSASYLSLLAPGALITAGGITEGGTSQASPHVAGAVAVLRAAFPAESLDSTLARLTSSSVQITDARNGVVKPRLDLATAARPANDDLAAHFVLSGASGTASGNNRLATAEAGEAPLSPGAAGHTVWWKWVAPASGQVSLDTHGSGIDTVLAVYTGTTPGGLQQLAANDNDGSAGQASGLVFQAQAGTEYQVAVDGMAGAQGALALNWSLNTLAQANLAITKVNGPGLPIPGSISMFDVTVRNAGPQTATHVLATLTLPAGVRLADGAAACTVAGTHVQCALGDLVAGTAVTLNVPLRWDVSNTQALLVSASSDLPDAVASDNSVVLQVAGVGNMDDADAPTLPQWAAIALGALMLMAMVQRQARVPPARCLK